MRMTARIGKGMRTSTIPKRIRPMIVFVLVFITIIPLENYGS
jgi:hypothetical protein